MFSERIRQCGKRPSPVTDGVLACAAQLREGHARIGKIKQRIIAESVLPARSIQYNARAVAPNSQLTPVRRDAGDTAKKVRSALRRRDAGQLLQEQGVVGGIIAVLSGEARGVHARGATQRVHGQPRIVAQAVPVRMPRPQCRSARRARLDPCVRVKCGAVLVDIPGKAYLIQ